MLRTLISIEEKEKKWIDSYSRTRNQSISETIRQAIRFYHQHIEHMEEEDTIGSTAGLWKQRGKDGLTYEREQRAAWRE